MFVQQVTISVDDFNDWPPVFSNPDMPVDPISKVPLIQANVPENITGKCNL